MLWLSGCAMPCRRLGLSNFQIQPRIMLTSHLRFRRGGNLLILRSGADVQKLPPIWRGPKTEFFWLLSAGRRPPGWGPEATEWIYNIFASDRIWISAPGRKSYNLLPAALTGLPVANIGRAIIYRRAQIATLAARGAHTQLEAVLAGKNS